ncbi:metal-dependent hydrolase [Halomicroarcula sp. GCM10025710]
MATTHALVAVAVASLFAFTNPESASVALVGAFAGGVFPDLDLYFGHRKTLHFPTYYWPVVAVSGLLVFVGSSPFTVGLFFFTLGAALHSTMDIFGGGLELGRGRPGRSGRCTTTSGTAGTALDGGFATMGPPKTPSSPLRSRSHRSSLQTGRWNCSSSGPCSSR